MKITTLLIFMTLYLQAQIVPPFCFCDTSTGTSQVCTTNNNYCSLISEIVVSNAGTAAVNGRYFGTACTAFTNIDQPATFINFFPFSGTELDTNGVGVGSWSIDDDAIVFYYGSDTNASSIPNWNTMITFKTNFSIWQDGQAPAPNVWFFITNQQTINCH